MQLKLMAVFVTAAVTITLAASLAACTDDAGIPDYYLPVPSYSELGRDMTYQMLIKDTRPAGFEPQKMLEEFDQLIATSTETREREFYTEMQKLADLADGECSWELNNYIFEILTLFKEHPDKPVFSNYVNYIRAYGPVKYNECLKRSERQLTQVYMSHESALDEFYIKYFDLRLQGFQQVQQIDEELYKRAKSLCLSSEDLRVKQTLEVAKSYTSRRYHKSASPLDIVKTFVDDKCEIFEKYDLGHALEIVNLGKALGAKLPVDFPVKYLKIIEYNRICIAWKKGDKTRPGLEKVPVADIKWFKLH